MNRKELVYTEIAEMIREAGKVPVATEHMEDLHKSMRELGLSSLDTVLVLMKIEEKYGIEFDEGVDSIDEMISYLEKKGLQI